jgi:hypothetical protein
MIKHCDDVCFVREARAAIDIVADAILDSDDVALRREFTLRFAAIGEPWLLRFLPEEVVARLTAMGFSRVAHLTPEKANDRYFQNRSDGLTAPILEQMIGASA